MCSAGYRLAQKLKNVWILLSPMLYSINCHCKDRLKWLNILPCQNQKIAKTFFIKSVKPGGLTMSAVMQCINYSRPIYNYHCSPNHCHPSSIATIIHLCLELWGVMGKIALWPGGVNVPHLASWIIFLLILHCNILYLDKCRHDTTWTHCNSYKW